MGEGDDSLSPPLMTVTWTVLAVLQERVPDLSWHLGRVGHIVSDHPRVDHVAVAGSCADWIAYGSSGRVRDGTSALRTFMERATRELSAEEADADNTSPLGAYDRFRN